MPSDPRDNRSESDRPDPEDNPGTQTHVPTTNEGDTPLDERYRMTSQRADSDPRDGAEPEDPGAPVEVIGGPNQGTDVR
uniref:hypothetical protein n=1 Tax=Trichocoleus desertorum TaxID=1481672 RepID=UPI0025B537A1|nr:hypothetical protein [Trichocoleus desertorum]